MRMFQNLQKSLSSGQLPIFRPGSSVKQSEAGSPARKKKVYDTHIAPAPLDGDESAQEFLPKRPPQSLPDEFGTREREKLSGTPSSLRSSSLGFSPTGTPTNSFPGLKTDKRPGTGATKASTASDSGSEDLIEFGHRHTDEVETRRHSDETLGRSRSDFAPVNIGRRRSLPFADLAAAAAGADPAEFDWEMSSPELGTVKVRGNSTLDMLTGFRNRVEARSRTTYAIMTKKPKQVRTATRDEWQMAQHLWSWCKQTHGTVENTFEALDGNKSEHMSAVEFAAGLRSKSYPGNETTYKKLFILFSQNGLMDKDALTGKYLKPPPDPTPVASGKREMTADERRASFLAAYDPTKEMMQKQGLIRSMSIIETKRQSVCQDLTKQDTVIGQWIQHLYISYMSLRQAFQQVDITGSGFLSKSQFMDGLRVLKVGNKTMLQMHTEDLFDRCDRHLAGKITLAEMLEQSMEDPLVKRLLKYLTDPRKDLHAQETTFKDKKEAESQQTQQQVQLTRVFQRMHDPSAPMDMKEFLSVLERKKYPEWHSGDLFQRLNRENPGRLSAAEFTVYLENCDSKLGEQPRRRSLPELEFGRTPSTQSKRPSTEEGESTATTIKTVTGQAGEQMLVKHGSLGSVSVLGDGSKLNRLQGFADRVEKLQQQGRRRSSVAVAAVQSRRGSI
eukprot:gnl/MRDRNA2_/MRDRNA2_70163_c0_seq1.p1 gnl/MRDRNA2_/MRDRNA2_70163_c0~~gnl/MRDRNA2_/MRDRNA2_70163_c0_seq1.p1  ORF type:complete len:672 (+),score=125.06 gnl/MRDRNA2_/MRDRNA2_70163_c0_seq1:184-2199(+)